MKETYRVVVLFLVVILLVPAVFGIEGSFDPVGVSGLGQVQNKRLDAHPWLWAKLAPPNRSEDILEPSKYELNFRADGTISIKADCNLASAKYTIDGAEIKITSGTSTLAGCLGKSRGSEMLGLIAQAQRFVIAGELLILVLKDGTSMGFRAPSIVDRCGAKALSISKVTDSLDKKTSAELDKALVGFVTPGVLSAPGASMLIITPKGRYLKSSGVSDVVKCGALAADSQYQVGSNTKMMTAAMIYQLQEDGQLSTNDLLSKWLPEFAAKLPSGDAITIDMLLTHTSGLVDYFDVDPGDGGIAAGTTKKEILVQHFSPEELVNRTASAGRSNFKPGEAGKWSYCNTGYILLGMIIEKVTGKSYEQNLQTRIFRPLKLKKTYLQTGQPSAGALPTAYYESPYIYSTTEWNASQGWSAGAVVSTSNEFAVFLKALFTGKLFKKKTTLGSMRSFPESGRNALGAGTTYGHGMMDNQGILGHGGQTLGFLSAGGYIPERDTTIVIWSNSASSGVNRLAVPVLAKIVAGGK